MALVVHFLEIDTADIPEFLKSSNTTTPRDLRHILHDNHDLHDLINLVEKKIGALIKRQQRSAS